MGFSIDFCVFEIAIKGVESFFFKAVKIPNVERYQFPYFHEVTPKNVFIIILKLKFIPKD